MDSVLHITQDTYNCEDCSVVSIAQMCEHFELVGGSVNAEFQEAGMTFEETLISLIQNKPALWGSRLPIKERSKTIKDCAWTDIAKHFGGRYPIDVLVAKWRNLRDTYIKKKQELETYVPSGSDSDQAGGKRRPTWKYFEIMSFLSNTVSSRQTKTNVSSSPSSSSSKSTKVSLGSPSSSQNSQEKAINLLSDEINKMPPLLPPPPPPVAMNSVCLRILKVLETMPLQHRLELEMVLLRTTYEKYMMLQSSDS